MLVDKGYQGAFDFCRVIHSLKKAINGVLTPSDVKISRMIPSCRLLSKMFWAAVWTIEVYEHEVEMEWVVL